MSTKEAIQNKPFFARIVEGFKNKRDEAKCKRIINRSEGLAQQFAVSYNVQKEWKISSGDLDVFKKWLAFHLLFQCVYPNAGKPDFAVETLAVKKLEEEARDTVLHQELVNYVIEGGPYGLEPYAAPGILRNTANSVAAVYDRHKRGEIDGRQFNKQLAIIVKNAKVKTNN